MLETWSLDKYAFVEIAILFQQSSRVAALLASDSDSRLLTECLTIIGTFALGRPEHRAALLQRDVVPPLVRLLEHSDGDVVSACARTLRTIAADESIPLSFDHVCLPGRVAPQVLIYNGSPRRLCGCCSC